jgi:hypothetical protein
MNSVKYVGLDVHQETISAAVLDPEGRLVMQSVLPTRAVAVLDFIRGLRGNIEVTFEEGTHSTWLYDLLARGPGSGVQSAAERAVEIRQQRGPN